MNVTAGNMVKSGPAHWQKVLLQSIGVFLVIFGCRSWLILAYGSDIPYWDQWDAEAMNLYIPYFKGELRLHDLFQPHNEHRIFLARLVALSLILVNGQWDALVEMTVNAAVYAGVGTMLLRFITHEDGREPLLAGALLLLFSLPFGWENTLAGFQISFYLMIGFSLLAMRLLLRSDFGSWQWFFGCCCALLLLFTLASGFVACLAVLIVLLVHMYENDRPLYRATKLPTVFFCLMVIAAGIFLKGNVPMHNAYHAHSVYAFVLALAANLSWPVPLLLVLGLCQWVPWIIFLFDCYRQKHLDSKYDFIAALGIMVILQAAAAAYSRGGGGIIWPTSRYQDILALGILVNLYILLAMRNEQEKNWNKQIIKYGFATWLVANSAGLLGYTCFDFMKALPEKRSAQMASVANIKETIKTNSHDRLSGMPNVDLPYPDPKRLATILKDQEISRRLPPSLNPDAQPGILRIILQPVLNMAPVIILCGGVCLFFGFRPAAGNQARQAVNPTGSRHP